MSIQWLFEITMTARKCNENHTHPVSSLRLIENRAKGGKVPRLSSRAVQMTSVDRRVADLTHHTLVLLALDESRTNPCRTK
jgi:hypothetical protein